MCGVLASVATVVLAGGYARFTGTPVRLAAGGYFNYSFGTLVTDSNMQVAGTLLFGSTITYEYRGSSLGMLIGLFGFVCACVQFPEV